MDAFQASQIAGIAISVVIGSLFLGFWILIFSALIKYVFGKR